MSDARTDSTEARPQEASAQAAEATGPGKHRGPAAPDDTNESTHGGRHRRPGQEQAA